MRKLLLGVICVALPLVVFAGKYDVVFTDMNVGHTKPLGHPMTLDLVPGTHVDCVPPIWLKADNPHPYTTVTWQIKINGGSHDTIIFHKNLVLLDSDFFKCYDAKHVEIYFDSDNWVQQSYSADIGHY